MDHVSHQRQLEELKEEAEEETQDPNQTSLNKFSQTKLSQK